MPTAFVLSGGGSRGDFQLGALSALQEMGIRPDIVCSTSVGSLNALMLTQGEQGVGDLRRIWMGLRRNDHMWKFADWWDEIDPNLRSLVVATINGDNSAASSEFWSVRSALLFGGGVSAIALGPLGFIMGALAGAAISGAIQNITADAIKDVLRILGQRAQSLLNIVPIRDMMASYFSRELFGQWVASGKKLRLAVVGLGSGQLAYVNELGELLPRFGQAATANGIDILEAAMASASIATVFPPVAFADDVWVDGGHRENIPLRAALDAGADRVIVICASPIDPMSSINRTENGLVSPSDFSRERILSIAERALLGIHLDELAAGDIYPVLSSSSVPISVIAPRFPTHDILTIDGEFIRANYNYGYRQAYDALGSATVDQRDASDSIALNDGRIARSRRRVFHQSGVPLDASVPGLKQQNAVLSTLRANSQLPTVGPVTHEAFPRGSELVPGDRLLPGQAIVSPDGRFRLIYQTDGNLVLYEDNRGQSTALWATNTNNQPLGVVVMQRDGNLVMYDDDANVLWASSTHGNSNAALRAQSDGNVTISVGNRQVWETGTSRRRPRPRPPGPLPRPIIRTFTMVNASPQTIRVRYFKLDDTAMTFALPGGEFTLAPGQNTDWTFPDDVDAAKVMVNQRHELHAEPGQTVTFATDDRLAIQNNSARSIEVAIYNDQDILRAVALPGGLFHIDAGTTGYWEFPTDIDRASVLINRRLFETVRRGSQLDFRIERRVFVTNQTGSAITVKFFRIDDAWRWVTLAGGDLNAASAGIVEFEVPPELEGVQVSVQGVLVRAQPGDRLGFQNGQVNML